ncbi:MAG: hypothetical protein PHF26_04070, partial [Candidatus Gracilibacteria bacterium]|nr:hypothetical protein [Candidatus Gracilibacteria bacterium]
NSNISGSLALLEFSGGTTNIVGSYEALRTIVYSGAVMNVNQAWGYDSTNGITSAVKLSGNLEVREGGILQAAYKGNGSNNGLLVNGNLTNNGKINNVLGDCNSRNDRCNGYYYNQLHIAVKGNVINNLSGSINSVTVDTESNFSNNGIFASNTLNVFSDTGSISNGGSGSIISSYIASLGNRFSSSGNWTGGEIRLNSGGIKTFSIASGKRIDSTVVLNGNIELKGNPKFPNFNFNGKNLTLNKLTLETNNLWGTGNISGTGGIIRTNGGGTLNSNISGSLALLEFSGGTTNIVGSYEVARTIVYSGAVVNVNKVREYSSTGGITSAVKLFGNLEVREGGILQSLLVAGAGLMVNGNLTNEGIINTLSYGEDRSKRTVDCAMYIFSACISWHYYYSPYYSSLYIYTNGNLINKGTIKKDGGLNKFYVKGNVFNYGNINSADIDTEGYLISNYGIINAGTKFNLYGWDKSLAGNKDLLGSITCKSEFEIYASVPNSDSLNLINCK